MRKISNLTDLPFILGQKKIPSSTGFFRKLLTASKKLKSSNNPKKSRFLTVTNTIIN